MRFVAAVALLGSLPVVSGFVAQGSTRRALVSAAAPGQWARFAEKHEEDSQVMTHEVAEEVEIADDNIFEVSLEQVEKIEEVEEVEKDEQTLFDEANMQKAIQLVLDR
jgi:hypothetical protein